MKSLLNKFLAMGGLALLLLSACTKTDTVITATNGTPGALTASATTLVLSSTRLTDPTSVITFNYTQASFGYAAAITNTLQVDVPSDNWTTPATYALGANVLTQSINTADFNNLMLKLGLKGGVASQVNVRMLSSIGGGVSVYSNVLTLTVTPFNLKSWLYVVGAFQGWNASSPDSLYSATSNGIYVGIINFTAGNNQFLILPAKNYNNKYATSDPQGSTSKTVTYNASNNFYAPSTAGQYLVTLNLNANTITFALANYYSVIGSTTAGGNYSTDVDMKYINDGTSTWSGLFAFTAGAFKIRENHDWTYSWGDISPADGVDATDNNGANINVAAAGNYLVTFTIPISAQGTGFVPSVTATYTIKKQ